MALHSTSHIIADGLDIFYRSAGPIDAPVILLLHGFPSSSHQFRNLIPNLSKKYRVIAPDLPGFGFTGVPPSRQYSYTFANLALSIEAFLDVLSIKKFSVYIFDYGAPVALRIALHRPDAIQAILTQNGNAYMEGFGADFWAPVQAYWTSGSLSDRQFLRENVLTLEGTKFQYLTGAPSNVTIPPESYTLDYHLLLRPGNQDIQLDLFYDYRTNMTLYPDFQRWMRERQVPVLAVWGKNDPVFIPPGAEAFKRDVQEAEVKFLDAGHFALETHAEEIGGLILEFLERKKI